LPGNWWDNVIKPTANNTGPTNPSLIPGSPGPDLFISSPGTYENLHRGYINVNADNVIIRNFRVTSNSSYGIQVVSGHTGVLFEDGVITDGLTSAIFGGGYTARRLYLHDNDDALRPETAGTDETLVECSFMTKIGNSAGAHADIMQVANTAPGGYSTTLRYNTAFAPVPGSPDYYGAPYVASSLIFPEKIIGGTGLIVDRNWLDGGTYTVYCNSSFDMTDNLFGTNNGTWLTPSLHLDANAGTCRTWSGNKWECDLSPATQGGSDPVCP
jgi:hypothetical protein